MFGDLKYAASLLDSESRMIMEQFVRKIWGGKILRIFHISRGTDFCVFANT